MDLKEQHIVWIGGAAILSMFGFAILTKCSPTSNVSMNRASLDKYNDVEDENLTESEYYKKYPIVKLGGKRKSKKKRKNNIR